MRTILACVAGVAGLSIFIAGPSAMAEGPEWEQGVQRVRFVAPEPQPASPTSVVQQTAPHEPAAARAVGYAFASDDDNRAASAVPAPADDTGYADPSDDSQAASAVPAPAGGAGFSYADDEYNNDWMVYSDSTIYCPHHGRSGRRLIGSTCTMGQHQAYFPPMHGYYYFHPYHHSHVRTHQMFAQLWGEDPANPYSNRLFQMVYEQYRDDVAEEQPLVEP